MKRLDSYSLAIDHRWSRALVALLVASAAVRPVLGFWYFLGGIGAPQNLLREKWALDERIHILMRLDRWDEVLDLERKLRAMQQR